MCQGRRKKDRIKPQQCGKPDWVPRMVQKMVVGCVQKVSEFIRTFRMSKKM